MAEYVHQYVDALLRRQAACAQQLGVDILATDRQSYLVNALQLVIAGVIMKAIVDKGAITDQEWLARLDTALDGTWPDWIVNQTPPPGPVQPPPQQ